MRDPYFIDAGRVHCDVATGAAKTTGEGEARGGSLAGKGLGGRWAEHIWERYLPVPRGSRIERGDERSCDAHVESYYAPLD